jgi:PAS domain S-box-containing protein
LKDGHTVHLGVTRDVTERRQAETIRNRLSAIVDSSDDAIISKDLNATITSWNKGAERLFGYTANEAIGRPITMLIPPDRIHEETDILGRLKRGEHINHFQTIRRHKDGTMLDVALTISPVKDASGAIVGASKIARNISEAKMADRARHLLSAIVDSSDDAIISKDLNGIITSWNKGAERLFGYSAHEAIGKPVTILIPADRLDEEPQILSRIRSGERIDHFETVRRRKDGTLLDISLTISPVKDSSGTIIGASKIARDITERKSAEEEIRRANRDLEQFAFSASHDLQEPLRTVKIYCDLLATRYQHKLDGQALEFLDYVRKGTDRMESLVRDLLAYTRATKLEVSNETVDVAAVLTSTIQDLSGVIEEAGAEVRAGALPTVRMHEVHLKQLLLNLIQNAIKYRSLDRPPVVTISAERDRGYWLISVADNGVGVELEYREKIFGLFKRLHTSDQYTGTGLGLAICQRIVDRYHGRIWVESEPGRGSTFRFTIPV